MTFMRHEAWAQICDGVSLIAGAAGALLRGPELVATDESGPPAASVSPEAGTPELRALLTQFLHHVAQTPSVPRPDAAAPSAAAAESSDPSPEPRSPRADIFDGVAPGDVCPVAIDDTDDAAAPPADPLAAFQPCQEVDRQRSEPTRRQALADDPCDAMDKCAYYLTRLEVNPQLAEDCTRSIEALPGHADVRVQDTFARQGIAGWQTYAHLYDECLRYLARCRGTAAAAIRAGVDPDAVLDVDREGRILFWLGDRPDVDVFADAATTGGPPAVMGEAAPGANGAVAVPAGFEWDAPEASVRIHPLHAAPPE